jgi:hypothetical protein
MLRQSYSVIEFALGSDDRKRIDERMKMNIDVLFSLRSKKNESSYYTLKENLHETHRMISHAKQDAGMGMPMQKRESFIDKLEERV